MKITIKLIDFMDSGNDFHIKLTYEIFIDGNSFCKLDKIIPYENLLNLECDTEFSFEIESKLTKIIGGKINGKKIHPN